MRNTITLSIMAVASTMAQRPGHEWQNLTAGLGQDFLPPVFLPEHYFGCGVGLSIYSNPDFNAYVGSGLQIVACDARNWYQQQYINVTTINDGTFQYAFCPYNQFISGGRAQYGAGQGDPESVEGIEIYCKDPVTLATTTVAITSPNAVYLAPVINENKYLCGAQASTFIAFVGDESAV